MASKTETKQTIIEAGYECLVANGPSETSVDDVARVAGVSRATMYRYFPGGRQELLNEVATWEYRRFFIRLYEAVRELDTLEEVIEQGLMVAHRAIQDHEVLEMMLRVEPEVLESTLFSESQPTRERIAEFLIPYLEREKLADEMTPEGAAGFLARMVLSFMGAPGQWDLENPDEVARLVRSELLAGIMPKEPSLTVRQI